MNICLKVSREGLGGKAGGESSFFQVDGHPLTCLSNIAFGC